MKIEKLESFYIVNKIKEHNQIKMELLNLMNELPVKSYKTNLENISNTDWILPKDFERKYLKMFYETIKPYMISIMSFLKTTKYVIHNGWFQQYTKNDFHDWHVHENCNYTNVYYLELPDNKMKTEILNINTGGIIDINVEEGDLITFPAHLHHRSKPIKDNLRKTIISFNSSFEGVNINGN